MVTFEQKATSLRRFQFLHRMNSLEALQSLSRRIVSATARAPKPFSRRNSSEQRLVCSTNFPTTLSLPLQMMGSVALLVTAYGRGLPT